MEGKLNSVFEGVRKVWDLLNPLNVFQYDADDDSGEVDRVALRRKYRYGNFEYTFFVFFSISNVHTFFYKNIVCKNHKAQIVKNLRKI